jgi:hypothetical protein
MDPIYPPSPPSNSAIIYSEFLDKIDRGGDLILYLILAAVGAVFFFMNVRRSAPWLVLGTATFSCLVNGFADLIAHGVLNLYLYRPRLHPSLPADDHLGLVLADLIFVPGLFSTLATVEAHRRVRVGLLLALLVVGIDWLFRRMGAIEYTGWQLWYTAFGFSLFAIGISMWTTRLEKHGYRGLFRVVVIATAATQVLEPWANISTVIIGTWAIRPQLFSASLPDQITGMYLLYQVPAVLLISLFVALNWLWRPWGYPLVGVMLWGWLSLLRSLGILQHGVWWHPTWEVLLLLLTAWLLMHLDRYLRRAAGTHVVA